MPSRKHRRRTKQDLACIKREKQAIGFIEHPVTKQEKQRRKRAQLLKAIRERTV